MSNILSLAEAREKDNGIGKRDYETEDKGF